MNTVFKTPEVGVVCGPVEHALQAFHLGLRQGSAKRPLSELSDEGQRAGVLPIEHRVAIRQQRIEVPDRPGTHVFGHLHVLLDQQVAGRERRGLVAEACDLFFGREHIGRIGRVPQQITNRVVVLEAGEPPDRRIDHTKALRHAVVRGALSTATTTGIPDGAGAAECQGQHGRCAVFNPIGVQEEGFLVQN